MFSGGIRFHASFHGFAQAPEMLELSSDSEMKHIERIMREGTGADRQLTAWQVRHDVKDVVDQIVSETYEGLEIGDAKAAEQAAIA